MPATSTRLYAPVEGPLCCCLEHCTMLIVLKRARQTVKYRAVIRYGIFQALLLTASKKPTFIPSHIICKAVTEHGCAHISKWLWNSEPKWFETRFMEHGLHRSLGIVENKQHNIPENGCASESCHLLRYSTI
jgi:hypothetical protein